MIPNIIHFIYGLKEQTEPFSFMAFMSIWSVKIVQRPEKIKFHYHFEPKGYWWSVTKQIPELEFVQIELIKTIGDKPIKKHEHIADVHRLRILETEGGVYLDTDTITVKKFDELLNMNKTVMAKEYDYGLCNAIMMSEPHTSFIQTWQMNYDNFFQPDGWNESSVLLPLQIAKVYPDFINVLEQSVFFWPGCKETHLIFDDERMDIPNDLKILHLWNGMQKSFCDSIGPEWLFHSKDTLYGKLLLNVLNHTTENELKWFESIVQNVIVPSCIDINKRFVKEFRGLQQKSNQNRNELIEYFNQFLEPLSVVDLGSGILKENWITKIKHIDKYLGVDCVLSICEKNSLDLCHLQNYQFLLSDLLSVEIPDKYYDFCLLIDVLDYHTVTYQQQIIDHIRSKINCQYIIISKPVTYDRLIFKMQLIQEKQTFWIFEKMKN
jgi:hypothetical protein